MNGSDCDRIAIVSYAPADQRALVADIRHRAPPSGRPIMDAHVTVKGTFVQPVDLDWVDARVRAVCAAAHPGRVETTELVVWKNDRTAAVALKAAASEEVVALKWALVDALKGGVTTTYYGEDDATRVFTPHVTLVQEIPVADLPAALAVVEQAAPRLAWDVTEIVLSGRRGGRVWEPLARYVLGAAAS